MDIVCNVASQLTVADIGSTVVVGEEDRREMRCGGLVPMRIYLRSGGASSVTYEIPAGGELAIFAVQSSAPTAIIFEKYGFTWDEDLECYDADLETNSEQFLDIFREDAETASCTAAAATNEVTAPGGHTFVTGDPVRRDGGTGFGGITDGGVYYVIYLTGTTFKLATSYENAQAATAIDITSDGASAIFTKRRDTNLRSVDLLLVVQYRTTGSANWVQFSPIPILAHLPLGNNTTGTPVNAENPNDYEAAATAAGRYHENSSSIAYSTGRKKYARDNAGLLLNDAAFTESSGHLVWPAGQLNIAHSLTGNFTLDAPVTAPFTGASGRIMFTQDGTGSRTITLGSGWEKITAGDLIDATASSVTVLHWSYDGTTYRIARISSTGAFLRKAFGQNWQTISSFASAPDASVALNMEAELTGNVTLSVVTNAPSDGACGIILLKQDATGSRVVTLAGGWTRTFTGTVANPTASSVTALLWQRVPGLGLYVISRVDRAQTVATDDIQDAAVTTPKLADASITPAKLNIGTKSVRVATVSKVNDTSDFELQEHTIAADSLAVGDEIELFASGSYTTSTTASNLVGWIKVNTTKNVKTVTIAMGTSVTLGGWRLIGRITVRSIGASGVLALALEEMARTSPLIGTENDLITVDTTADIELIIGVNTSTSTNVTVNCHQARIRHSGI